MQHQIPSQPNPYQYQPNGIHHDITTRGNEYTNGHHSNGEDMNNNPYQQYGGYQPPPPQHQQHAHQQQQHPQQHPQQQQMRGPPPPMGNPYMQSQMQNQLPPLGQPSMGPPMHSSMPIPHYGMSAPPPPISMQMQSMQAPQQSSLPPQPRASNLGPNGEKKMSHSTEREGFRYELKVLQQPQRARMCGFGDKDRRPITPPPCVKLVIIDISTGEEVSMDDPNLSDPSFFILQVDLWAETADREANVVRASSNSPAVSISSATTTSYPPPAEPIRPHFETQQVVYMGEHGVPVYAQIPAYAAPIGRTGYGAGGMFYGQMGQPIGYTPPPQQSNAMYTRNLIGSLTVNAARLNDDKGKPGFWFVLQDLSVRTEGFFRLRMSFIDISNRSAGGASGVNRGKAPVLAWTFSDKFQVYSAKKFPGVIESTPLSKCFASQGIKIPIRKDNKNEAADDDDGD